MSYRQLTPEEEKLEGTVWSRWEMFLYHMQESSEFVAGQTPVVSQTLDDKYQVRFVATSRKMYHSFNQNTQRVYIDMIGVKLLIFYRICQIVLLDINQMKKYFKIKQKGYICVSALYKYMQDSG